MQSFPLAVVAALGDELRLLRCRLKEQRRLAVDHASVTIGTWGPLTVLLVRTGMGPTAMERALFGLLKEFSPQFYLHVGYGGATIQTLRPGDLVVATTLTDASRGQSYEVPRHLVAKAEQIRREQELPGRAGSLATLERVARSPREKAAHGREHRAIAVDMESAVLARICRTAGLPFLVVRAILDHLDFYLPEPITESHTGHLLTQRVNPFKIPPLSEFAEPARRHLTAFAAAWIEEMAENRY